MTSVPDTEQALRQVQQLIRRPAGNDPALRCSTRLLPSDLTAGEPQYLSLLRDEITAMDSATDAVQMDLRFEHLPGPAEAGWRLAAQSWGDRTADHVPAFVSDHGQQPVDLTCYLTGEHLSVEVERHLLGIRLLPVDDISIPEGGPWFHLEEPVGCVAAIGVQGTSHERMVRRARELAAHALRVLRIALGERHSIHDWQLRFGLGDAYVLDDHVRLGQPRGYGIWPGGQQRPAGLCGHAGRLVAPRCARHRHREES